MGMSETPQAAARRFSSAKLKDGFRPEALHEYEDSDGKIIYYRIRLKHPDGRKWIRPMHANGHGYALGEPEFSTGKPLYRLPDLVAHPDDAVWIVEGEWTADALARMGLVVTTTGAADSAARADWSPLAGRIVTIWPDDDAPGLRYAQQCAAELRTVGASVDRIVDVAKLKLPKGGDAVDWIERNPGADPNDLLIAQTGTEGVKHSRIRYRRAIDIEARPIRWLWSGRIARGKVSMLAGNPGVGKSQITASMAAIVSTGGTWPVDRTHCERGNVVILSAEDDPEDTIKPRLEVAGADLARVIILDGIVRHADGNGRGLTLRHDLHELSTVLDEIGDVALVVIDPITAYLGDTDSHKNAEIRGLLTPLFDLAAKHGAAIVCVSHLNKSGGTEAMMRITGSLAFVAAARAAFLVAKDQDNDARRLLLPIKNNLGNDRTGLAFGLELAQVESPAGVIDTSRIIWESEAVTVTADEVLRPRDPDDAGSAREAAAEWLREVLADGPMPARDVRRQADEAGHNWATIRRAQREIGVNVARDGFGRGGRWRWSLDHRCSPNPIDAQSQDVSTYGNREHLRTRPEYTIIPRSNGHDPCPRCDGEGCAYCDTTTRRATP